MKFREQLERFERGQAAKEAAAEAPPPKPKLEMRHRADVEAKMAASASEPSFPRMEDGQLGPDNSSAVSRKAPEHLWARRGEAGASLPDREWRGPVNTATSSLSAPGMEGSGSFGPGGPPGWGSTFVLRKTNTDFNNARYEDRYRFRKNVAVYGTTWGIV
jgi:hypothetical protein